jgi:hypothetical protein
LLYASVLRGRLTVSNPHQAILPRASLRMHFRMMRQGISVALRRAIRRRLLPVALLPVAFLPTAVAAQWRVTSVPANGTRPADVTVETRERADTVEHLDGPVALVIRCSARQLEGFVTTRDKLESDIGADIQVRIESDSVRPRNARWQATKSNTGAFVPTRDLRELVQRYIMRSATLRIMIPTMARGRVTYVFPVADFRLALEALREECTNDRGGALAQPAR